MHLCPVFAAMSCFLIARLASGELKTYVLMRGGFGGGMHAMLRHFVDAPRRRVLMEAEELIERAGAFADWIGFLDRLGDISLREDDGLAKLQTACKLRGYGR